MKKWLSLTMVGVFLTVGLCFAEERATSKDAESMVKRAVEFYKANGKDKALSEFNNPSGKSLIRNLFS